MLTIPLYKNGDGDRDDQKSIYFGGFHAKKKDIGGKDNEVIIFFLILISSDGLCSQ